MSFLGKGLLTLKSLLNSGVAPTRSVVAEVSRIEPPVPAGLTRFEAKVAARLQAEINAVRAFAIAAKQLSGSVSAAELQAAFETLRPLKGNFLRALRRLNEDIPLYSNSNFKSAFEWSRNLDSRAESEFSVWRRAILKGAILEVPYEIADKIGTDNEERNGGAPLDKIVNTAAGRVQRVHVVDLWLGVIFGRGLVLTKERETGPVKIKDFEGGTLVRATIDASFWEVLDGWAVPSVQTTVKPVSDSSGGKGADHKPKPTSL